MADNTATEAPRKKGGGSNLFGVILILLLFGSIGWGIVDTWRQKNITILAPSQELVSGQTTSPSAIFTILKAPGADAARLQQPIPEQVALQPMEPAPQQALNGDWARLIPDPIPQEEQYQGMAGNPILDVKGYNFNEAESLLLLQVDISLTDETSIIAIRYARPGEGAACQAELAAFLQEAQARTAEAFPVDHDGKPFIMLGTEITPNHIVGETIHEAGHLMLWALPALNHTDAAGTKSFSIIWDPVIVMENPTMMAMTHQWSRERCHDRHGLPRLRAQAQTEQRFGAEGW